MKKINASFGHGEDTILFSVSNEKLFSYETDHVNLHEIYGGKKYYTARSGLSGAGYLNPTNANDDLIQFGWYRVENPRNQSGRVVVGVGPEGCLIHEYAPIKSHQGLQNDFPVILTDGVTVALLSRTDVKGALQDWSKIQSSAMKIAENSWEIVSEGGRAYYREPISLTWGLYNPRHFEGVNALDFVDLRPLGNAEFRIPENPAFPFTCDTIRVFPIQANFGAPVEWAHMTRRGYVDRILENEPRKLDGDLFSGWVSDGVGTIWQRRGLQIYAFSEVRWADWNPDHMFPGHPNFVEFEIEVSTLDWFSLSWEQRSDLMVAGLNRKSAEIIAEYERGQATLRDLETRMRENPEARVMLADSYAVGNCQPGTERFLKEFDLTVGEEGISFADLLNHRHFGAMLEHPSFRRTIDWVLAGRPSEVLEAELTDADLLGTAALSQIAARRNPLEGFIPDEE